MERRQRIEIVASIAWVCLMGMAARGKDAAGWPLFDGDKFLFTALVPVAAYWAWKFIRAGKTSTE